MEKLKNIFGIEIFFMDKDPKYSDFLDRWRDCDRASLRSSYITIRSLPRKAVALEFGDISLKETKGFVSEYDPKLKNIGIDDPLIQQAIETGEAIYKEDGLGGLQLAVIDCYQNVDNISSVKSCFTQHLYGFDLDRTFTSRMEEYLSREVPKQEFFQPENVQTYADKAF